MSLFKDKTLLITGGTGSFGNVVLNRFLKTDIGEIRIFSRDEKKQDDMRHDFQMRMPEVADKIKFYIGDVRDIGSVRSVMHGVDYIFHAAALKQVPSCEFFPMEAVRTNVIGTDNVLTAAIDEGVECVICLSTDKAAYPINSMGMTKAIEEKVAIAKSRMSGKTKICCTRYGNVMCSRGSVIPLWIDQIKSGNPITVTEPSMTRFIMSLEEAVDLVLFAFEHGENGDLLIKKAPACTIQTQAEAVCELFGGNKDDIKDRINQIKAQIEGTTSEFDKEKLQERLAKLSGGVAVIKVGAATEVEMKEKKLRIEDALAATKAAVEEGIVAGGGTALINAMPAVSKLTSSLQGDEKTGAQIVLKALEEPVRQIAKNAGLEGSVIIDKIIRSRKVGYGFDAYNETYVDMIPAGIVDPTKVTRSALQNAASVAAMVLTTESLVADIKEETPAAPAGAGMGGMGGMY